MTKEELRIRFYALQKEYRPIMDMLTEKQYDYPEYLGFDAAPSKLIIQPKVLFLGYNPAGGKDWWRFDPKNKPHLFLWPHLTEDELFFLKKNSARRENAEWYELNKPVNNKFSRQMVDLLYELAGLIYKNNEKGTNVKPSWAQDTKGKEFIGKMMFMNLYPVGTKDEKTMISLFRKICKENNTLAHCEQGEWHLRLFFIGVMHQMIKLIDPKLIVCMGSQTFFDYTYSQHYKHSINDVLTDSRYDNLIGYSRKGSWDGNIPNIAKTIYQKAFCE